MKTPSQSRQYTLRNVPAHIDQALRRLAKKHDKSVNQLLLDLLEQVIGAAGNARLLEYRDLDALVGSWVEDPQVDEVLKAQDVVDAELWK